MNGLTAFQRDILYIIAGEENPHGLEIKESLGNYYDEEVNHGRLYPNLDTLVSEGLVNKGQKDKRTNWYALTQEGESVVQQRRRWENQRVDELG
jgi:DNA-binding PadR family transcriptional regulator